MAETEHVSVELTPARGPLFTAQTVASLKLPMEPVVEVSHCHESGSVPVPDNVLVTISAWSTSITVALGDGAPGGVNAGSTTTCVAVRVASVAGDAELSVTDPQ
ncbi:MAG: hypothetical protein ACREBT_06725 [Thermoplasmata archaeon]